MRFDYASTELGQIHYRETGSGPVVVLFHASPISGEMFKWALPILAKHTRAIAPDTPGYGSSEPPLEPLSIAAYAKRLSLFLDELGLEKVALVGYHSGAAIAIQIAVDQPRRVHAMVIAGSPLFYEDERKYWLEEYLKPFVLREDGSHLVDIWNHYRKMYGQDTPLEVLHMATTEYLRTAFQYDWLYRAAFLFEAEKLLPRIECPTLFLVNKGDILKDRNERSVELTSQSEGKCLEDLDGPLPQQHPSKFAEEVISFLERTGYLELGNQNR